MATREKRRASDRKEGASSSKAPRPESPALVESKERPSNEFVAICCELNIGQDLLNRAWRQYDTIGQQCALEGTELPWIACSIYLTLWQSVPIGQEPDTKFAVSKLIQVCEVSVLEFFEKLSKWVEMVNGPRRLQEQVNRIQGSLAVSAVVFKKFLPIFRRVFAFAREPKRKEVRKRVTTPIVFETIWMLFIALKKQFAGVGDDLLNCFHLLLCAVDLVYTDLRTSNKLDFLNAEFVENMKEEEESVLETLCRVFEGVVLDAKHFRTHWWIPRLKRMIDDGQLQADSLNLTGFLDNNEQNLASLHEFYEDAMLRRGEMDERMFIPKDVQVVFDAANDASPLEQLKSSPSKSTKPLDTDLLLRMSVQACLEKLNQQKAQPTPLTGKSYVISGDQFCPVTPISGAVYNANKLANLLNDDWRGPTPELDRIMSQCRENPKTYVADTVRLMGDKIENRVAQEKEAKGSEYDASFTEHIKQHREQADCLFYRLLEKVAVAERERASAIEVPDLSAALHKEEFLASVYACTLELLIFTYESEREFPWVIEVLRLVPVHYYKVIELIIRAEPELSREMVKHLNKVEERVLEELAWSMDSPLWTLLARRADGVPSCQAVALPSQIDKSAGVPSVLTSQGLRPIGSQTPYGMAGRYASPIKVGAPAKRRLEFEGDDDPAIKISAMQGLGSTAIRLPSGQRVGFDHDPNSASDSNRPASSTALFFRKVYYLASVRLLDLCERLRIDERGKQRVWTLFEHVLRTETSLMAGRHLDQNLMCCVYVVAKITKQDVSFHDIMYHYRHQPQASSRVYRRVLLDPSASPATVASDDGASRDSTASMTAAPTGKLRSGSTLPVPGLGSAPPTPEPKEQDFADLIKYYNRAFVSRVEDFVKKLQPPPGDSKENSTVPLSPIPTVRSHALSPRRNIADHVSVQPMPSFPMSPARPLRYSFNRSPSKVSQLFPAILLI
uniref:Retinoblastoma-like protein 1 n=1 Tax=Plectus sambesii TaxID=2011161 RepID=A0A914X0W0_9BILA